MGIQFVPQYGFPILLEHRGDPDVDAEREPVAFGLVDPARDDCGLVECVAIIGWIVA